MTKYHRGYFKNRNDEELINAFNREVGNPGWTSSRGEYLAALREEFENRQFDYSDIGNKNRFSIARRIKLVGKKIVVE